jgi:hypothetical protein
MARQVMADLETILKAVAVAQEPLVNLLAVAQP